MLYSAGPRLELLGYHKFLVREILKMSVNHPILDVVATEVEVISISLSAAIRTGGSDFFGDDGCSDFELNLAFSSGVRLFHFSLIS